MMARPAAAGRRAIVVATSNPGKLREFREILAGIPLELLGLDAFPKVAFPPEGDDYEANAAAKALAAARALGLPALADDSGLEVDALGGAPGPRSARFGGPRLDARGRTAALLEALADFRESERAARFVCVAALAQADGPLVTARGECSGRILRAPRGTGGFGYDPVFEVSGGATMASLPPREKNRISHRARALAALEHSLEQIAAGSPGAGG
ncbi:MAG: RdgB/HAM1 family non-canonical purine NTP pyrophosphatase [Myxococcota bacterium]